MGVETAPVPDGYGKSKKNFDLIRLDDDRDLPMAYTFA